MTESNETNDQDTTFATGIDAAMGGGGADEGIDTGYEVPSESSPQKSALMLLLLIVAVGGGGIFFMHRQTGPSAAVASPESEKVDKEIKTFLNDGGKDVNEMKDLIKNTEKVVQQFLNYPSMTQVKLDQLKRNPFLIVRPKKATPDEDLAKKALLAKLEREKEQIRADAGKLQLQSILYAETGATCMISSRAYSIGGNVKGFVIEKINKDSVVVSKDKYRFELTMPRPH